MPRSVPTELKKIFQSRAFHAAQLLRIAPVNGPVIGYCNVNTDIDYDDGDGLVTYKSLTGFEDSAYQASIGSEVDNAEAKIIFPSEEVLGLTEEQVRSGYLRDARFRVLLVDYMHLSAGHAMIEWGFVGQVKIKDSQSSLIELRGVQQFMRQRAVCERGSKTCRAKFGDASTGCYFDLTGEGGSGEVTLVDEPDRTFASDAVGITAPATLTWTSGKNAGLQFEVETSDTTVGLMFPTPYVIEVGDTFTWLPDCDKQFATCKTYGQTLNFRGEPYRPEAIGPALQFPGAST